MNSKWYSKIRVSASPGEGPLLGIGFLLYPYIAKPKGLEISLSLFHKALMLFVGFPGDSDSQESACNAGDWGLILGSGRSSGEGNDNPLQYSCLENPMDRRRPGGLQSMGSQRVGKTNS